MGLIIFIVIVVAIIALLIASYNGLVRLRVRADSSWSDIDVQLKRRHDLIPNLVETVKGYASHEKSTFEDIAKYRSAENYPQLRASEQFTSLQNALQEVENTIQEARRYYNAVVRDYNTKLQTFPTSIIAGIFNFAPRQFFHPDEPSDRENVAVKF